MLGGAGQKGLSAQIALLHCMLAMYDYTPSDFLSMTTSQVVC